MPFVVDTHVHAYPGYDLALLLRSARENLAAAAPEAADGGSLAICLTERRECSFFDKLASGETAADGFDCRPTAEPCSLCLTDGNGRKLLVIGGYQAATSERIEVLAIGSRRRPADGLPLAETINSARRDGSLVVLPWALGKWSGRRGRLVSAALATPGLFAGDSRLRPRGWPRPGIMRRVPVLAGSDPLPLPGEESAAGSYAGLHPGNLDLERPAGSLLDCLRERGREMRCTGLRLSPAAALRLQMRLRRG